MNRAVRLTHKLMDKNLRTQVVSPTPLGGNIIFLKSKNKTRNTKFRKDLSKINFFKTSTLKTQDKIGSKISKKVKNFSNIVSLGNYPNKT